MQAAPGSQTRTSSMCASTTSFASRVHAFGRYSYFANANSASTIFGPAGGTGFSSITNNFGGSATGRNQSAVAGMDIGLNPKLLTDFRLGYLRYHVSTEKYDGTTGPGHDGRHPGTESWVRPLPPALLVSS